jgi:hypothetical protein
MARRYNRCTLRLSLITLLLSIAVLVYGLGEQQTAWASSGGRTGYSGNPATHSGQICTNCHSGGSVPTVTLTGPTSLATGESGTYTLTITGGAAVVGGLDVSTTGGTLQATGSNTRLSSSEITQTASTSFAAGSLAYTFTLVAPSTPGTVTLYGSGLSANGNGSTSGDSASKATLDVTVASASAPNIVVTDSVSPTTDHQIPFGTVTDGVTSDQTVTITNTGNADLVIGTIASANPLAAPFSISISSDHCSGQTIAPAASCSLTVEFAPTGVGLSNDSFDIPSNDSATGTVTVSVSGTGAATPVPVISVTDSVSPTTDHQIPFGTVTDGVTSDQTVTITNTGNADLVIGTIASANPLAAPFSISISSDHCSGQTIAPAASCSLTVEFAPTGVGLSNDSFDIPSNDSATGTVTVSVSGTGAATPVPVISVTDSVSPTTDHQIPFGTVTDGVTSDQTVTITNTGNADLVIGTIASANPLAAPFSISISSDNCSGQTIAPAGACALTVRFAPTAVGLSSDSFDIPSNDTATGSVTISVSGTGTATPVPVISVTDSITPNNDLSMPFGDITEGITSNQTVTITNTGNAGLVIGTIASANPLAAPFSITSDNCSGQTIAPASACSLTVRFAPTSVAASSDSFDIPSNDTATGSITMNVSGTGLSSATNNPPSAPTLVSPTDGQTGVSTTVSLQWNKSTDPDNDTLTYHLYYCTDSTFVTCTPVNVASRGMAGLYLAGSGLLFFGFVFTRGNRGKALMLTLIIAALLMTGALFTSCGKSSDSNTTATTQVTADMTHQASGLSSGTTYYWKIVADDGKGGLTSSATWSFTTQ